jgi:hypothetical protein
MEFQVFIFEFHKLIKHFRIRSLYRLPEVAVSNRFFQKTVIMGIFAALNFIQALDFPGINAARCEYEWEGKIFWRVCAGKKVQGPHSSTAPPLSPLGNNIVTILIKLTPSPHHMTGPWKTIFHRRDKMYHQDLLRQQLGIL